MKIINSIFVSEVLKRENNNLDLFRIIAACMVIVGHSYVLFPDPGEVDLIRQIVGFTYSSALAVKIFFFISGLVVSNSLISSNSFLHFVISRSFRIFPALFFICVITVFVLGPVLTLLNTNDYFSSTVTFKYLINNIIFRTQYDLPGVFTNNHYVNAVNGSLWTLPYEIGCYLFLLSTFLLGILKNRIVSNIIFGIIILESILPQRLFTYWLNDNPEILPLPAYFSVGALLALNKEKIRISHFQTLGFSILTYILWNTRFVETFFCLTIFSFILNLSASKFFLRFKIKNDISYGIYLWGFVVQQTVQHFITGQTVYLKMFISILISSVIAYISWILIEKNSIRFGKKIILRLNSSLNND